MFYSQRPLERNQDNPQRTLLRHSKEPLKSTPQQHAFNESVSTYHPNQNTALRFGKQINPASPQNSALNSQLPEKSPKTPGKGFLSALLQPFKNWGHSLKTLWTQRRQYNQAYHHVHTPSNSEIRMTGLSETLGLNENTAKALRKKEVLLKKLAIDPHLPIREAVLQVVLSPSLSHPLKQALYPILFKDPETSIRKQALNAIVNASPRRFSTFETLALHDPEFKPLLENALFKDSDLSIQTDLIGKAITFLPLYHVRKQLQAWTQSPNPGVRIASIALIRKTHQQEPDFKTPEVMALLKPLCQDPHMAVRTALIRKIPTWLLPEDHKLQLINQLEDLSTPEVRYLLVNATSQLDETLAYPKLRRYALNLDFNIRRKANFHTANLSSDSLKAEILKLAAQDPDPGVRKIARQTTLQSISNPEIRESLLKTIIE
jgi:hypothetical protein